MSSAAERRLERAATTPGARIDAHDSLTVVREYLAAWPDAPGRVVVWVAGLSAQSARAVLTALLLVVSADLREKETASGYDGESYQDLLDQLVRTGRGARP